MIAKNFITSLFILLTSLHTGSVVPVNANEILTKVSEKLSAMEQLDYYYERELSYTSEKYYNKMGGQCYFDFTDNNPLTGFRFSFKGENTYIFNGAEYFHLNSAEKTMQVTPKPKSSLFQSTSFFYNSLLTLRNSLPLILTDSNIKLSVVDTVLNAEQCYKVSFKMLNRRLAYIKGFEEFKFKVTKTYDLYIDKQSNLPTQIIEKSNLNNDFVRTTFTHIDLAPKAPVEQYWYYSTYTNRYIIKAATITELIKPGTMALNWKLPLYGKETQDSVELRQYRGKLTLMDFWIKNCGPCILSVPELNAMNKTYAGQMNLISINAFDRLDDVNFFLNKYKPQYPVVYNGQSIAKQYGVTGYPAVVLVDKNGQVLYAAAGFDRNKIEAIVKDNL